MARRKRNKKKKTGGDGWTTTFSDLMTLLLTFFVLLFSMSEISDEKFSSISTSIQGALIGEAGGESILEGADSNGAEATNDIPLEVSQMYGEAMTIIEEEGISEEVSVSSDQDGVYIDIQESILFDLGQSNISEVGRGTLDSLSELLLFNDNDIIIEGFTDDVPMNSARYPSNWELSAGRAMSVVRYLAEAQNIDPKRLSGRGYGEFNPVEPNDTPENRAANRRVNIVLVYQPEGDEE